MGEIEIGPDNGPGTKIGERLRVGMPMRDLSMIPFINIIKSC